jgi:hypothetical protein
MAALARVYFPLVKKSSAFYTCCVIVTFEPSARRYFSRIKVLFEARATKERVLHLRECSELIAIYFHFFKIFNIQIGEMAFCKSDFIIIKLNYFQNT